MTRKSEAGRQAALGAAMGLFWKKGAETASYNDIVVATGLSRKALYREWPDKDALVHEALDLYRADVLSGLVGLLRDGKAGLTQFWQTLDRATRAETYRGCFLFRTGSGPMRQDPKVAAAYNAYLAELQAAIAQSVRDGQKAGDIDAAIDAEAAGWQCVAIVGMISALGAQAARDDRTDALIDAARRACGLIRG